MQLVCVGGRAMSAKKITYLLILGGVGWQTQHAIQAHRTMMAGLKYEFAAKQNMATILRTVRLESVIDDTPNFADLAVFIRRNINNSDGTDPSIDPWGTPYRHETKDRRIYLLSAGPDKQWNTEDDLEKSIQLGE